ncbi:MAG: alpha/beta hydrolase fold domain-containing protein, partial [Phycisphaerales bacterium]|nr:alpha/beta hydrolase fold domain-containing protein [Phycisphaerales bacterium]
TNAWGQTPEPIWISYGEHWQQTLELYLPVRASACGGNPLAIYIHGGGWLVGDSSQVAPYLDSLLSRGFAVASLNYRWSQNGTFPAQIQDVKSAVSWLNSNANQYNINPDRFGAFGDSAGGHLAALLGTTGDIEFLSGGIGVDTELTSQVQAVADLYGPTDLFALGALWNSPESEISQLFGHPIQDIIDNIDNPAYADLVALVNSANPITHVTSDDPPFYIAHGADDDFVPPSQSEILHSALVDAEVPSTLNIEPGFGHELPMYIYEQAFDYFENLLLEAPRPSDTNCDGTVNITDLLAVIAAWGPCPSTGPCPADVTGDEVVNIDDLLYVIANWG